MKQLKSCIETVAILMMLAANPIFQVGIGLIVGVTFWDVLKTGWVHFFEYAIGPLGIVIIWFGLALVLFSWSQMKEKTK